MVNMISQSASALSEAHEYISQGEPGQAKVVLENALPDDLENEDLSTAISFCAFWIDVFESLQGQSPFDRGETLMSQWCNFSKWVSDIDNADARCVYAFKKGVFTRAVEEYSQVEDDGDPKQQAEIFRKKGLCSKRLGNFESALESLKTANSLYPSQAEILAELADCYDLCGETKWAKILFKEAFYIDAEKVDLENLDSPLVHGLIDRVENEGFAGRELKEWIPVYGVLLGVFNVKRGLRSQEIGRLKQEIYAKENELKDPANNSSLLVPRLMNLYFWLMDYYLLSKESTKKINELLLKIKILDASIYNEYFDFDEKSK